MHHSPSDWRKSLKLILRENIKQIDEKKYQQKSRNSLKYQQYIYIYASNNSSQFTLFSSSSNTSKIISSVCSISHSDKILYNKKRNEKMQISQNLFLQFMYFLHNTQNLISWFKVPWKFVAEKVYVLNILYMSKLIILLSFCTCL